LFISYLKDFAELEFILFRDLLLADWSLQDLEESRNFPEIKVAYLFTQRAFSVHIWLDHLELEDIIPW